MKKVRFESSYKAVYNSKMSELECHSPRPFLERQAYSKPPEILSDISRVMPYSNDPVQMFECSNSSPYPSVKHTFTSTMPAASNAIWNPSKDLEISILDASSHQPRQARFSKSVLNCANFQPLCYGTMKSPYSQPQVLSSIENKTNNPPNILTKEDNFFLRRDNLDKFYTDMKPLQSNFKRLSLDKENEPTPNKIDMHRNTNKHSKHKPGNSYAMQPELDCSCHHCVKNIKAFHQVDNNTSPIVPHNHLYVGNVHNISNNTPRAVHRHCSCAASQSNACYPCNPRQQPVVLTCNCQNQSQQEVLPLNAVDKKAWIIEKYEKKDTCMEVDRQTNISKEKREPTVADLFKIIKLQNEQLQMLQEKVDEFISTSNQNCSQNCTPEPLQVENKLSIGVMTSFEMVRTSTIINKEVKQSTENAQIQCNKSQISIKEVVSKSPANLNFLDGIMPVPKVQQAGTNKDNREVIQIENEEKTFNELSLYNVHIDNSTTPHMSPEQSLCLDVRDYSESETGSVEQSNVGWTYYNKVMTHVNGMLQDSDMPSSASALFRNTRQQCVQMQIDKTNVSVTKRVKFGDDPLGVRQTHVYTPATDTSFKMNQLAAKYLNKIPPAVTIQRQTKPAPTEMSFATRNYMERHNILKGSMTTQAEVPRFLDITALKQQPKLL